MPVDRPPVVLLVEDDPNFAARVKAAVLLWNPAAQIHLHGTGQDAVDWMYSAKTSADLVLVDLGLPDMEGTKVIDVARRRNAETPILVVSLLTSERSVIAAIRSGANGYIIKDGSDRAIANAIAEVVAGNYPLSPALARYLFRLVAGPKPQPSVDLTERETETLRCIGRGLSYDQTGIQMGISLSTVQSHVRNLYRKLDIHSQTQAAIKARDRGLV